MRAALTFPVLVLTLTTLLLSLSPATADCTSCCSLNGDCTAAYENTHAGYCCSAASGPYCCPLGYTCVQSSYFNSSNSGGFSAATLDSAPFQCVSSCMACCQYGLCASSAYDTQRAGTCCDAVALSCVSYGQTCPATSGGSGLHVGVIVAVVLSGVLFIALATFCIYRQCYFFPSQSKISSAEYISKLPAPVIPYAPTPVKIKVGSGAEGTGTAGSSRPHSHMSMMRHPTQAAVTADTAAASYPIVPLANMSVTDNSNYATRANSVHTAEQDHTYVVPFGT